MLVPEQVILSALPKGASIRAETLPDNTVEISFIKFEDKNGRPDHRAATISEISS